MYLNTTKTSCTTGKVLWSYNTPVGVINHNTLFTTSRKYSTTTSKQIIKACQKLGLKKKVIDHEKFITLYNQSMDNIDNMLLGGI